MIKIPIFFTFDNGYVPQASVTFISLLETRKSDVFYELKVLFTDITKKNQLLLQTVIEQYENVTLDFITVPSEIVDFEFNNEKFSTSHLGTSFTKDTLYRCIPDLIPEFSSYDTIIYSDVDIVVVDDISDLIHIKFQEQYLAGVKIPYFLRREITHLQSKFAGKYFAGGLWVMNLKQMRKDKIGQKALELIKNPPFKLRWNDQDVMNLVCDTNVLYIPYTYISIPNWLPRLKKRKFKDKYYKNKELYEAMYNPKIVHYAGKKPWNDTSTLKSKLWFSWVEKTPFSNQFTYIEPEPEETQSFFTKLKSIFTKK